MTILFIDGFDWTQTAGDFARKYDYGGISYSSATGRWGGRCATFDAGNQVNKDLNTTYTTVAAGIAQRPNETGSSYNSANPFLGFRDEYDVYQIGIHWDGNDLKVVRGDTTILDTVVGLRENNIWNYWELKVYIHATAGTVMVRKNEQVVVNLTSQNTKNGSDYIQKVMLRDISNSQQVSYDDFWITTGELLGDCRITTLFPDSDETHTDFAPSTGSDHYAMVDDADPDDDSTYVDGSILNAKDSYGVTPSIVGEIKAVQIGSMVKKTGSEGVTVKNLIRSSSTDYPSTEERVLTVDYRVLCSIHETDPADSNPWTNTKVGAAEFGLQITAITTTTTTT